MSAEESDRSKSFKLSMRKLGLASQLIKVEGQAVQKLAFFRIDSHAPDDRLLFSYVQTHQVLS